MTAPQISVKTEVDFDFIANYNGDENTQNSQNSQSSARPLRAACNNTSATMQSNNVAVQQAARQLQHLQSDSNAECDDEQLQQLLKEFDLPILFTTLKLHDITFRSLRYLSTDDINAAIRHIGYRSEFREKLFTWRNVKHETLNSVVSGISHSATHPAANTATQSQPQPQTHSQSQLQLQPQPTLITANKKATATIAVAAMPMQPQSNTNAYTNSNTLATTTINASIPAAAATPTSALATIIKRSAPEDFLSLLPGVSGATARMSNNMSAVLLEPTLDLREAFSFMPTTAKLPQTSATVTKTAQANVLHYNSAGCGDGDVGVGVGVGVGLGGSNDGYLPKGMLIMTSSKVHVVNVLESTHIGRSIKQFYQKNGFLENQHRNEIVRLIIEEVMQRGESLSPKDFRAIMSDIITVFPNEKAAADYYFIYRRGKSNPLGRLYQRYANENSKRRKLTRLTQDDDDCSDMDVNSASLLDDDDTMSTYPQELPGRVPRIDEMTALALKQLLTTDHFSWEEVCDKWIQTWTLRQKELLQSGLAELLTNWAKLADPRAAELYKIDFRHVFPDKENLLLSKWDEYVKKVTPLFDKRLNHDDMKKLYKYCKMGMASKDEKDFIYAVGLTALLPSTGRFKDHTGKLKIRASISDSIDSFVMRLNTLEAYESRLELYNRKFGPINRSIHPFLVVIMPNECTISKIYVALENHFYCMQSFLQALDLCYKIYHTCGLKYPTICENVWTFVQRYFYDMTVPWEARNANLVSLIMSLTMQN